jgi:hypothetical protein
METVRADVAWLLAEDQYDETDPVQNEKPVQNHLVPNQLDEKTIWDTLSSFICNDYGVAGLMGNFYAESGLKSINLQTTGNKALGMTDEDYTAAVDNGVYMHFADDRHGYGLAQWTYPSRKEALLAFACERGVSIGDCAMQLAFVQQELGAKLLAALRNATSVREASNAVMLQYERPKDQSVEAQDRRVSFSQRFYDQYHKTVFFRVRKSWNDKASQLGAFHVFQYAMNCADAHPGYAVFDEAGEQVYPEAQ